MYIWYSLPMIRAATMATCCVSLLCSKWLITF